MLMQSTESSISLLPALPEAWKDGRVEGICARGGFVVDMTWKDGRVTDLRITARADGKTQLCFNEQKKRISLKAGESWEMKN